MFSSHRRRWLGEARIAWYIWLTRWKQCSCVDLTIWDVRRWEWDRAGRCATICPTISRTCSCRDTWDVRTWNSAIGSTVWEALGWTFRRETPCQTSDHCRDATEMCHCRARSFSRSDVGPCCRWESQTRPCPSGPAATSNDTLGPEKVCSHSSSRPLPTEPSFVSCTFACMGDWTLAILLSACLATSTAPSLPFDPSACRTQRV